MLPVSLTSSEQRHDVRQAHVTAGAVANDQLGNTSDVDHLCCQISYCTWFSSRITSRSIDLAEHIRASYDDKVHMQAEGDPTWNTPAPRPPTNWSAGTPNQGASLVAVLHAIQDEVGFIPPEALAPLARAMKLSRAEVHGVHDLLSPFPLDAACSRDRALCRAEACRSMGSEALAQHIEAHTGCHFDPKHGGDAPAHGATSSSNQCIASANARCRRR